MTAFESYSRACFSLLLLGGLVAGCSSHEMRETMVPEVIPAQVCSGDMDSDGDGVTNCHDLCPGSMAGEAMGPDGCPVPFVPKPFKG
ncbi:MAG: hypothetical protein ABIW30_03935 [Arenimonas sp.]